MPSDWTQPPLSDTPGDLRPVLEGAHLHEVLDSRPARRLGLRFALPEDAGTAEATFSVEGATHLLAFAYLPPASPPPVADGHEAAVAVVGDWARQGLIAPFDPAAPATALVVQIARLHVGDSWATLEIEGYGEDPDRIVWWRLLASGAKIEPGTP